MMQEGTLACLATPIKGRREYGVRTKYVKTPLGEASKSIYDLNIPARVPFRENLDINSQQSQNPRPFQPSCTTTPLLSILISLPTITSTPSIK
jgi:hypothetical protein